MRRDLPSISASTSISPPAPPAPLPPRSPRLSRSRRRSHRSPLDPPSISPRSAGAAAPRRRQGHRPLRKPSVDQLADRALEAAAQAQQRVRPDHRLAGRVPIDGGAAPRPRGGVPPWISPELRLISPAAPRSRPISPDLRCSSPTSRTPPSPSSSRSSRVRRFCASNPRAPTQRVACHSHARAPP